MSTTTTSTEAHAAIIGDLYAAFGRGDIPAVLERLDDDVSWDGDWPDNHAQRGGGVDHMRPRHGVAGATEFFGLLAGYTFHDFRAEAIIAGDQYVIARVTLDLSTPAGGRLRDEELHLWTFGADGKIVAVRHYLDTAKHIAAARGEDTTVT